MKDTNNVNNILGFGHFIFDITLNLNEIEQKEQIVDFEKINSLKDCQEILKIPSIVSQLQLTSTNPLINMLLFTNRCSEQKMLIEFIGSSRLILPDESKPFESVILDLLHKNNIIFIESNCTNISGKIDFIIKNKESEDKNQERAENNENNEKPETQSHREIKSFNILSQSKEEDSTANNALEAFSFIETEGITFKESKIYERFMKKVRKMQKKSNLLSKFSYDFRCTSFFLLDLNDFMFSEFANILDELPILLQTLVDYYKHLRLILTFPVGSLICKENADILSKTLAFGDYIIFDKNDVIIPGQENLSLSEFYFSKEQELNILKDVHSYKMKGIKHGLFIEDLRRFSYLELEIENNHTLLSNSFVMALDPSNKNKSDVIDIQEIEQENKKIADIILLNYDLLKFSFLGAYFSKIFKLKSHISAYECGFEVFKKLVDLFRNGFDIPIERNYFFCKKVNIPKFVQRSNVFNNVLKRKEENFLLDCNDLKLSTIKPYNPILDKHMTSFFENKTAGKFLHQFNVINKSGISIKNIYNRKIVNNLPIEADADLKKFYREEVIKIFPEEKDLPKLKLAKLLDKIPSSMIKKVETSKNPNNNTLHLLSTRRNKESINITKHVKNASSVSHINVNASFWDKHNISIKESPYIQSEVFLKTKPKLKKLDYANYNKFLTDIENKLKNSTNMTNFNTEKISFWNSNYGSGTLKGANKTVNPLEKSKMRNKSTT